MSKEVDERVVEMRFNNALFESKVQQTMRSLAALNEKLMFKGAEKGFEKVSDSSEKVKFNALLNALDNLSQKFSAVEVIGVTALMRITNQAVDAGERLVKALSLDPIISGFQEYETQINAVQTILANTSSKGTTLDQVNAALDELNHYADLTIYNFTEMTRNIGTFTAAGVDLNTSVSAIKGIANLAAVSGSTSQQASTAMYQLSQALASGTVKLQDWNSVVNAGMGGQVFQDALKETARVHGIAIDSMIKKEGSFRETLSKGWLTSSILTETLQKFTGDLNEETLKSIGYTDEQIKKIMEMGKTANDAATKVKTFSQLKDTLTEALQSGWTQTWQTIIGDFEEAKELFTRFSDVFSDLINKSSEARNTVLAGGLNTGWQQLSTALGDSADFYSQMLEKVMLANGSISQKQIDDAGSFVKALQQGGVSAEQLQNGLKESYKQLSVLGALSDDALKAKKLDPAQVRSLAKSFEEVNQKVADGSLDLDIYSKKIGELSGREHLIESIWNVFEALEKVVEPVARAWQKIFSPITADQIYNIAKSIDEFTAKLSISDETADKIERTFSGIFAVLNVWKNMLLTVSKVLGEVFNAVSPLAGGFLSITASLGDCLVEMANAVNNSKTFKTTLDGIHWIIGKVSEGMQTFAGVLTDVSNNVSVVFDPLKTLGEWFENFISFITPKLKWLADKIGEIFEELGSGASGAFGNLNGNALWGFANAGMIAGLIAGIKGFLEAFKDIGSTVKDTIGGVAELLNKLGEAVTAWKNNKNAETLKTISTAVAILAGSLVVLSMVKPERLAASTGAMIALFAELLVALAIYDEIAKKTKKVGKGTSSMVVMAAGVLILTSALKKISEIETEKLLTSVIALGAVMAELVAAQVAISKWAKDGAKHAMSMLAMAAAVRVLAEAVEQLADLGWDGIEKGLIAVAGLLAEVAAFSGLSNFGGLTAGKAVGILILAAALSVLEKSVSAFSKMPVDELQNGIGVLGAILGEIAVFSMLSNPAEHVLSTATALTILSGGLLILSNALANLGGMTLGQIGVALAAMAGGLIEMGVALTLVKGSLGSATSFLIMSVVLNALVSPLKSLGEMSLEEIGHGLLAVGGALGIFAIAVGTMSLAGPIVIAVSAALSLLAGSFALLLGTMAAVSLMPLRVEALVVALGTLGSAIGVFIAGVIAGLGTAAGSIAIAIAEIIVAVCNAIAQAVPAIGNALAQLIVAICNVIVQCSEPIGQALFTLGTVVIQTIIDLIAWAWDGGGEGGGIKGALSELLGNIVAWLSEHLNPINLFGGLLGTISGFFGKIGEYMSQGLANGLNTGASVQIANNGVQTLCNKVKDFFRNAFGINSPSTWMRELGQWFAPGLINGLNGTASIAKLNAGTKVFGENVKSGLSGTFDGLNSWMFNKGSDAASSFYNGLSAAKNVRTGSKDDWFDEWYQGITTSILGTVEALQNMNAELEKTRLIQQQLADGKDLNGNPLSKDDVNDLKDQLLSSRSSMVSFAGALADAMGLEDSAKSAVVKLANAIQKNWVPISNACSEVWTKVSGAMGEEMTNTLSTVFKAAFSEEGMEIGTEFVSAIASAMQGDYAGAIISAATGLIDLLFTDTGKQLTGGAGDMLLKLFSGIQNGDLAGKLANIGTAAANVGNSLSGLLPMLGQLGTTGAGAGMAVGGIGEALGGLGASILAVLPELLIVVGIISAIAALIGGIAWFISSRKKEKATGAKDVGSEIDKGISDGVKEDAPIVDDAVSDMTENAMDIAKGTLGTISKVMGDDYEYTPQIVPVVDLTNVLEGADEIDNAFAATKSLSLDGDVSRNLANKIDAEVQLQNGLKSAGNEDTLRAINALAGHMDGVAESIKGMSVTINGRKAIGYIDDRMGRLTAAKVK